MYRNLVDGAVDDNGRQLPGRYKPHEIGRITAWQLQNLFSRSSVEIKVGDHYTAHLHRQKIKGESAFETWRKWKEELAPIYQKPLNSRKG